MLVLRVRLVGWWLMRKLLLTQCTNSVLMWLGLEYIQMRHICTLWIRRAWDGLIHTQMKWLLKTEPGTPSVYVTKIDLISIFTKNTQPESYWQTPLTIVLSTHWLGYSETLYIIPIVILHNRVHRFLCMCLNMYIKLEHFITNLKHEYAQTSRWPSLSALLYSWNSIGSCNGLVSPGNKPLHEPV